MISCEDLEEENVYVRGRRIGEGTFGTVYLGAHVPSGGRPVALKCIRPPPSVFRVEPLLATTPLPSSSTSSSSFPCSVSDVLPPISTLEEMMIAHESVPPSRLAGTFLEGKGGSESAIAVLREALLFSSLQPHQHIVALWDVYPRWSVPSEIVVAMEFLPTDLQHLIRSMDRTLFEEEIKCLSRMLLDGLAHCHRNGVMHRDVKPSNLLLTSDGMLKLADFGLARLYVGCDRPYSHQVATRWYRAVELLFGARKYDFSADMWSVGCIIGELFNLSPLFPGDSDIDQLQRVFTWLGTPRTEDWPEVNDLPDYKKIVFSEYGGRSLGELIPSAPPAALDLIHGCLSLNPSKRLSAEEALDHEWFGIKPPGIDVGQLPLDRIFDERRDGLLSRIRSVSSEIGSESQVSFEVDALLLDSCNWLRTISFHTDDLRNTNKYASAKTILQDPKEELKLVTEIFGGCSRDTS